ncbi:hypothetical protein CLOM_g1493 [Closterium sp. NIES-68]|nr:hypothetical protein CLOM_g1493 [Closterium sp. NIES-68]
MARCRSCGSMVDVEGKGKQQSRGFAKCARVFIGVGLLTILGIILYRTLAAYPEYRLLSSVSTADELSKASDCSDTAAFEQRMLQDAERAYVEATEVLAEAFGRVTQPREMEVKRMWDFIFVPTYPCPRERRIGRAGDGGKWTCAMRTFFSKPKITVFSIGSHGDPSFEKAVQKVIHAKPFTFDPFLNVTTLAEMQSQPFMRFRNVGLVGLRTKANATREFPGTKFVTLEEAMQHEGREYIDVFKIDCEGCEYPVLDDLMERYTARRNPPIGQLLIEFHGASTLRLMEKYFYGIQNMGFRLFHVERNAYFPGYCAEFSFIHESLLPVEKEDAFSY